MQKPCALLDFDDCRRLGVLLHEEARHYRRLLRLAVRQNSYMQRQDVDRLASNAREWATYLPRADAARIARERLLNRLAGARDLSGPAASVEGLLEHTDLTARPAVINALREVRHAAARLARQNEQNRILAEFCLDLAREETEIFKRVVLEDPTGCYDDGARNTERGPGGVIVRQA
jgi:hypothetical protein